MPSPLSTHRRYVATLAAASIAALGLLTGCLGDPAADGERPGVVLPSNKSGGASADTKSSPSNAGGDRVLAQIGQSRITESQLMPILIDAYGLDVMLKVVQLQMAKNAAGNANITISPKDIDAERQITMQLAFPEQDQGDYENLLNQLLTQQRVTRAEFEVVMETNAYLRAMVRSTAANAVSEEAIRNEFNTLYGERVRVRHIALNNLQDVAEARRRLAGTTGENPRPPEPFEQVAREMSRFAATARAGGALPPFSRQTAGVSEGFRAAAFTLAPGEVSTDTIQDGGFYHIIKVEQRIAPTAVKYEDVREYVRSKLVARREQQEMATLRGDMADAARRELKINEPTMKKQFEARLAAANPKTPADNDDVNKRLDAIREATQTTRPAAATAPTTQPN